ncbi:LON peptidase substrate-binding domain-containing protein [Litorimonas cladophorae]|jgi:Lon protease-like protein|uniref:LON peptidase substrate-binding domain-containing protein n=1 Tax=Litorimonas cladophorae TaxID=1220491 RepID=UPI00167A2290|nr:LON peptidase substrate-binding domain-containing protein [Litorimonas cladophorae]
MSAHYKSLARRTNPESAALFPLSGTVLLPGCDLPLNIFEPRYLNMIDDALRGERLIGMVQSQGSDLAPIGGLGRISQFSETEDGRYLVVLKGLKRFRLGEELDVKTPYRQAKLIFDGFEADADTHDAKQTSEALSESGRSDRAALTVAMKSLAKAVGVQVDWDTLKEIPLPLLINQAAMISPFQAEDKQSLLEAATSDERRRLLIGLMHLYAGQINGGGEQPTQ